MKKFIAVIGVAGAGKTTFIEKYYKHIIFKDLLYFEKQYRNRLYNMTNMVTLNLIMNLIVNLMIKLYINSKKIF